MTLTIYAAPAKSTRANKKFWALMKIFDRYLLKNLFIATVLTAVTLAVIIFLTQSLKFLELVIDSGASSTMFWILTMLALPRFFEIILPIALMASVVFVYNKMVMDSELVIMRSSGAAPLSLGRPAINLSIFVAIILWVMTAWVAPTSLANMQKLRQVVKAQYSSFLFQEGVFNAIIPGLTVFVRDRSEAGELKGLMIHDKRDKTKPPVTVLAESGVIVTNEAGQQVVVFDGSRQDLSKNNKDNMVLNRLDFDRYTIDLPEGTTSIKSRWKEPDERTLWELFNIDETNESDVRFKREFMVEIHRRLVSPLLAVVFTFVSLSCMLLGAVERRGQGWRVIVAITVTVLIQALYLAAFNMARESNLGLVLMYLFVFVPLACSAFLMSNYSENFRMQNIFRLGRKRNA